MAMNQSDTAYGRDTSYGCSRFAVEKVLGNSQPFQRSPALLSVEKVSEYSGTFSTFDSAPDPSTFEADIYCFLERPGALVSVEKVSEYSGTFSTLAGAGEC